MDENFFVDDEKNEDDGVKKEKEAKPQYEDDSINEEKEEISQATQNGDFTKFQKVIANIFYLAIVIACIITSAGSVYTLADIVMSTGKMALFLSLSLGYQIAIVAGLIAGLFFLLIFFLGLFRKGTKAIARFLFKAREIEERYKNRPEIRIAAIGLLISIIVIIVAVLSSMIVDLIMSTTGSSTFSLVTLLNNFSDGGVLLFVGIMIDLAIALTMFIIWWFKNGYALILKMIGGLEKDS